MKKQQLSIIAILLTLSSACSNIPNSPEVQRTQNLTPITQEPMKTEYIKITPQEAQSMMSNDVMILDVRTQEEFEDWHVINAVLLPDYKIKEQAENVIIDKNQTVLVYCRTGRRSETASKELIDMGYTKVFDFGGINDWTGEVVRDGMDTVYYNYFGDELPKDIITPFVYTTTKTINNEMSEFDFRLEGTIVKEHILFHDKSKYYIEHKATSITKLTISSEGENFQQEFTNLQTDTLAAENDMYGLSLEDWNFDGYLDIGLWRFRGGTLLNSPHYYWLWDNATREFTTNTELEDISGGSTITVDYEKSQICSMSRYGSGGYGIRYYEYRNGNYIMVKSEDANFEQIPGVEDKYGLHIIILELIDGEMIVTQDYYQ